MAQQRRGLEMGVLLLFWQLFGMGFQNVPIVTLLVTAGQVLTYFDFMSYKTQIMRSCDISRLVFTWGSYLYLGTLLLHV